MANRGRILSLSETSEVFGAAPNTVLAWIRRGLPVVKRATGRGSGANRWELDSAAAAEGLREQAVRNAVGDLSKVELSEARRRKTAAEARREELEVRRLEGRLVDVDEVAAVWSRLVVNFRTRILNMPSKLAGRLVGLSDAAVIKQRIEDEAYSALQELSDDGRLDAALADTEGDSCMATRDESVGGDCNGGSSEEAE